MEIFVEPFGACAEIVAELLARRAEREVFVLKTDLQTGGKEIIDADAPGPSTHRQGDHFYEAIYPAPRVVLFGCGHLARAIGPLASGLDFEVVICDDNATGAIDADPSWADVIVPSFSLRDVEQRLRRLGPRDYLLILTRDHGIDQKIVEETLLRVSEFDYLGLIGSMGKVGRFKKRILAKGQIQADSWDKLHAPIGLDICAETPQEIAVSIMAELIALKNKDQRK